ncbi:CPXV166 protein, partial [Monkeypox virus]
RLSL